MIPCPICGGELKINIASYDVPFFGKVLLTSVFCSCGFKHSDSIITDIKKPVRFKIKINGSNLFTKVVRSTSGTIRIPEIGVDIEPGPASQAYITNLEGVLFRVENMVRTAMRWNSDDKEKVKRCEIILEKIRNTMEGKDELTLVLEDPFGNSAILSEEAFMEVIGEEEAKKLKVGLTVLELTNLTEEDLLKNFQS
ncbi:MAG: ZPR1 zinc finger domain-containing protein [Archaeoglobales archaeon]|nr:ZPR1 zinc finger domain-containing protein [Archaeoglobales archaeon]